MSQYVDSQLAGFNAGTRNLTSGLQRLALMQGMQQQRGPLLAAEAQEAAARTGLIGEQTKGEQAKTAEILQRMNLTTALQNLSPGALAALQKGDTSDPAVGPLLGTVMADTGANKGDTMKALQTGVALLRSSGGDIPGAAGVANPVSVQNNAVNAAERAARPVNVPTGGTLMSPGGQPLGTGTINTKPGEIVYGPQGNITAGSAAVAPPPQQDYDPTIPTQPENPAMAVAPQVQGPPAPPGNLSVIARGMPLPVKPTAQKPMELPAAVQDQIFNYGVTNNPAGTNNISGGLQGLLDARSAAATPGTPVPTTPAAPAPSSMPSGLSEGQRVRNKKTGAFGIVKNGQIVPQ